MKIVPKEQREEWRKEMEDARHSALDEYCPKDEFNEALESIDTLEARLEQVRAFCQRHAGHRLMQVAQPFRELINILKR